MGDQMPLVRAMGGQAPFVWTKGSRELGATWRLLHNLQVVGTNHSSHFRNQREDGLPPLGVCEQAPPAAPVTSEVGKKEGTETEHHPLMLSHPWKHTHPAAATAKCSRQCPPVLDHYHFPGPCN